MEEAIILTNLAAQAAEAGRAALPLFWWIGPLGALIALAFAYYFYTNLLRESEGTPLMVEIAEAIRAGAMAYLRRQYRAVAYVFLGLFIFFAILAFGFNLQNPIIPFAFITAGFFSGMAGYIGMRTATRASARTANAARESLNAGLRVAFRAGAVMGMGVVGFALLDMSLWFLLLYYVIPSEFYGGGANPVPQITAIMLSAAMGASTMALFARVGGGIYTKAADVGADLVGKVEAGIPEDDPRNPATIADNVGDNVGDVAGMGADLYESFSASILATAALGVASAAALPMADQLRYVATPVMLAGVGVLVSILGIFLVRADEGATMKTLIGTLDRAVTISSVIIAAIALPLLYLLGITNWLPAWLAVVVGLTVGIVIGRTTEYYTSSAHGPTQGIAAQARTGPATVIIDGLAVGMRSTVIPIIAVILGTGLSFYINGGGQNALSGLFGVGLAAVGMLSTLGLTLSTDAYGPIADNAGGNAEMSKLDPIVRQRTDQLDALGNTTAATGKGFAIGSAALTALALLAAYIEQIRHNLMTLFGVTELTVMERQVPVAEMTLRDFTQLYDVSPLNPLLLFGLFIGAGTAFYFCALTMSAVGRAAGAMVEEVRRQFREFTGILEGTEKPDYARCVAISTDSALREMIAPSALAIVVPLVVGVLMGVAGVLGLLAGTLTTGFALALMMANSGGAWDNAKKYIEEGAYGGKGSPEHKAAVVGDTVGDPFKDTSGPSLNILIKLMSIVSVVLAGVIAYLGHGLGLLGMLLH